MGKHENTLEDRYTKFLQCAKSLHGNRYNYDKVEYVDNNTPVIIECEVHGYFKQRPRSHAIEGKGCKLCGRKRNKIVKLKTDNLKIDRSKKIIHKSPKRNKEMFISISIAKYGDRFDYSKLHYINSTTKITLICKKHGEFVTTPPQHLRKNGNGGCILCSRSLISIKNTGTLAEFLLKAKNIHGDKFTYGNSVYINQSTPIIVTCKLHGDFEVRPKSFLRKSSLGLCPKCPKSGGVGWRKSSFINRANGRLCNLYIIKCEGNDEIFYKVGITLRSIYNRFETKHSMPYKYSVIHTICSNAEYIWNLEHLYHKKLIKFHYTPKIKFGGSMRECFSSVDDVLKEL